MAHSEHLIESRPVATGGVSDLPSNADTESSRGAVAARADPLIALLIADDPADARHFARRLTRTARASRVGPVRVVHVDTVAGPWDCVCKPPDGASLRRILCRARDRHHLVQELDAARHVLAARDRAVGIVSHDLRNSLGSIHICAAALLDPAPPSMSGTRQMAQIILRATAWMQRIVQDLCDWFWQAEHRRRSGAGLGLAIAKGPIEAHGGCPQVESAPGHGSTFWFTVSRERCHRPLQTAACVRGATSCPAPS